MKTISLKSILIATILIATSGVLNAQDDAEGCKDYPLFNRMPSYYLSNCEELEFGSMKFPVGAPDSKNENRIKSENIEGKIMLFNYQLKDDKTPSSGLQIMRNFQNASRQNGGIILGEYQGWCTGMYEQNGGGINGGTIPFGNGCTNWGLTVKFTKDKKEIWIYVQISGDGEGYDMVIVEKEAMNQYIQANEMFDKINSGDALTLYINFESGKSAIKSESQSIIDELYKMLSSNPNLKIIIEGHTDNVGNAASNKTLSEQRAASVKTSLVSKGISADRIKTIGFGQDKPVADNSTEDGKAKNRRVEIKKQ
jgi:outer membrane protein OmpA-like peptidoglycan-associated protein